MTILLHKDHDKRTKAYNLQRYKDQNGNWVELHKNKRPRGKVFMRLHDVEWAALGDNLRKVEVLCRTILAECGTCD